jgi:hypothetical protein
MSIASMARAVLLCGALLIAPVQAWAKTTTINDVTVDVPAGFTVESSSRGLLAKTPDEEVYVWVETYLPDEEEAIRGEHVRYWKHHEVALNDDPVTKDTEGTPPVHSTAFLKATWKGDPTIVRYVAVGPFGPKKEMVLITYWASPEGDKAFNDKIVKMVDTMDVNIQK